MDATNLDELKEIFEGKIAGLTRCMNLSSTILTPGSLEESCKKQLTSIHMELCMLESLVGQMRELLQSERLKLQQAQIVKDQIEQLAKHLHYVKNHIPERLPGHENRASAVTKVHTERAPLKTVSDGSNKGSAPHSQQSKPPSGAASKNKISRTSKMEFITVDEFQGIPKYMKGRLTYDTINSAIELINSTVSARYSLLQKPRSALGEASMKRVRRFREQENKDTKGVCFFTEEDFKASSNGQFSTSSRSIFTILRHSGRLREIRSPGLTRYALAS